MQQAGEHKHRLEDLYGRLLRLGLGDPGQALRDRLPAEAPERPVEALVGVHAVGRSAARRRLTQLLQLGLVEPAAQPVEGDVRQDARYGWRSDRLSVWVALCVLFYQLADFMEFGKTNIR